MDILRNIELPYWLMIGGAILFCFGFGGLLFTRSGRPKGAPEGNAVAAQGAVNSDPDDPSKPRPQMPPLPSLLDSSKRKGQTS